MATLRVAIQRGETPFYVPLIAQHQRWSLHMTGPSKLDGLISNLLGLDDRELVAGFGH